MRENPRQRSLVFPIVNNNILLGLKKEGQGAGNYNGFGGKQEETDESILHTTIRELYEEANVRAKIDDLEKVAIIDFVFPYTPKFDQQVHVFFVRKITGEPKETKEMAPLWINLGEIDSYYPKMWASDRIWFPPVLRGEKLIGKFIWKEDGKTVDKYDFRIVQNFEI